MKKTLLIMLFAGFGAASMNAQVATALPKKLKFKKVDSNKDKMISLTEAKSSGNTNIVGSFTFIDVNNDNYISKDEFNNYKKQHAAGGKK
jgi:hypothetical protein